MACRRHHRRICLDRQCRQEQRTTSSTPQRHRTDDTSTDLGLTLGGTASSWDCDPPAGSWLTALGL